VADRAADPGRDRLRRVVVIAHGGRGRLRGEVTPGVSPGGPLVHQGWVAEVRDAGPLRLPGRVERRVRLCPPMRATGFPGTLGDGDG
jgi:hypothetical protein